MLHIDNEGVRVFHIRSRQGFLAFSRLVRAVGLLRVVIPISILVHFRNLEMPAPVIGQLGGLFPRVNPSVLISTDVTNDPIEEELRLPVSMNS